MMWSTAERAAASLLALLLAGCQSAPPDTAVVCRPARSQPQVGNVYVSAGGTTVVSHRPGADSVLMSPMLGDRLSVRSIEAAKSATGMTTVLSEFANCTDAAMLVRVRTQFLDAQGRPSEPVSIWRDVSIGLRSVAFYEEKALSPASRHFLLEVDTAVAATRR